MRVNVYAEEMTDRIEITGKEIDGHTFTGLRFYLELPATLPDGTNYAAPFVHRPGDDDSAAVTFWGKRDLRDVLRKALAMLDAHYEAAGQTHDDLLAAWDLMLRSPPFNWHPENVDRGQAYRAVYKDALHAAVRECVAVANENKGDARATIVADTCATRVKRLEPT